MKVDADMPVLIDIFRTLSMQDSVRRGERVLRWGNELWVILLETCERGCSQPSTGGVVRTQKMLCGTTRSCAAGGTSP